MAIPMFLDITKMEPSDPCRRACVAALQRQAEALKLYQDAPTGLWHTLIDDSSSYLETSCSAGFAAGLMMGVRHGLLERSDYLAVAVKALEGCCRDIAPTGIVGGVSKGTAVGRDLDFYRTVPIVPYPYGQSLVIVALVEYLVSL